MHDTSHSVRAGGTGRLAAPLALFEPLPRHAMTFGAATVEPWHLPGNRVVDAYDTRADAGCRFTEDRFVFLVANETDFSNGSENQPLWVVLIDGLTSGSRMAHAFRDGPFADEAFSSIVASLHRACTAC